MAVDVIIGLQRGDEGKGRFVDLVAGSYDIVARGNGGANAGHTIVPDGMSPIALHQIPSGIAYKNTLNIIGGGVYLDAEKLAEELKQLQQSGIQTTASNLLISNTAHLVMPHHIILDEIRESGAEAQGSTKSGIAYVASDKYLREGIRLELVSNMKRLYEHAYDGLQSVNTFLGLSDEELQVRAQQWVESVEQLKPHVQDTVQIINEYIQNGKNVLVEGAQAFGLDIDHGMYPYVTSSSTTVSGLLGGLGIAPKHVNKVTGVAKIIKSHVGGGPFVTEITDEILSSEIRGEKGAVDSEYGATTKRPRRIGYPDLPELRSAILVNGVTELALSKMDHVERFGSSFQVAVTYKMEGKERLTAPSSALQLEQCTPVYQAHTGWDGISTVRYFQDLPKPAQEFVNFLESSLNVPVSNIGVGPERQQVIVRSD
jgi:adenylosuccinate synthase